jgi:hypothetical protein
MATAQVGRQGVVVACFKTKGTEGVAEHFIGAEFPAVTAEELLEESPEHSGADVTT